jgi:hypothetical protein
MRGHLVDNDWLAQPMTLSECTYPLEYAVMRDYLADDAWVSQPITLQSCAHPL